MSVKVGGNAGVLGFTWDVLDQWKAFCQWNSQVGQLQMDAAEELRGESFQRRYEALIAALNAGSEDSVTYLFEKKIVGVEELSDVQQLECWKSVKSVEMRAVLEKEGLKISSQAELLRYVKTYRGSEVFESFLKAGVDEGLEEIYDESKRYDTHSVAMIRSYVQAIRFCKGDDVPLESMDEKTFEVIRYRANLNSFQGKQLAVLWIMVCQFDYFDEQEGSFFTTLVDLFFAKEQRPDIKFSGFIKALDAKTDIPRYLLEKEKIVAGELTQEQHSQCWTKYNYIATAPVLKQYRFNVDAETVVDGKPTYPINIVVQMDVEEDSRLSRVIDLLESGATCGVQEALAYCRENKLQTLVQLIEQHQAGQRFLQQFDGMTTKIPNVDKVLTAIKGYLEVGTIRQIVLSTKNDLGTNFYAIDLMPLLPILERMGILIAVTHIYDGNGVYRPHELKGGYTQTAGCKFIVSFQIDEKYT